jgi:Zn-dependent protease
VNTFDRPSSDSASEATDSASRLETIALLRAQLTDILADAETLWNTSPPVRARLARQSPSRTAISFRGHLVVDPAQGYALLRDRFAALGYTPLLHERDGYEIVTALPVVFGNTGPKRWWINLVLLLLTIASTTLVGALLEQEAISADTLFLMLQEPQRILSGIPASLTIMGILGIHELAHYVAAHWHGLDSSLPYFIPVPFGLVGTLGAVIRMRKPFENRNALFDVGAAGPLAGILVALPLFFVGLMSSPAMPPQPDGMPLGTPLLLQWMESLVYILRDIPQEYDIYVNSWTFTAWFALFVSGLNLLPIGQLDGGHVAYAMLGSRTRILSIVVLGIISILGILMWPGWYLWTFFIFLSGWLHPPPLNALEPLSTGRKVVGVVVFALMVLLFTPTPFPGMWT